jgi:hypothetical protein
MTAGSDRVLVDTSAWIETLRERGDAATRDEVRELLAAGNAVLCDLVAVELWNGARSRDDQETLRLLESDLECVPTTDEVWRQARRAARLARSAGLTLPASDLVIAACARIHRLRLLHRDAHFDRLVDLEGWKTGR